MIDLIPVEALTRREEYFRCDRLRASLRAGVCVARQDALDKKPRRGGLVIGDRSGNPPSPCFACPVGARVRARLGAQPRAARRRLP